MSQTPIEPAEPAEPRRRGLWAVGLILAVLALLVLVSEIEEWHSRQVSLPRYCDNPEVALARLAALWSAHPQSLNPSRRDYMVAAKLEFLLPRASGETTAAYRQRLLRELATQCRRQGFLGINSLIYSKKVDADQKLGLGGVNTSHLFLVSRIGGRGAQGSK